MDLYHLLYEREVGAHVRGSARTREREDEIKSAAYRKSVALLKRQQERQEE